METLGMFANFGFAALVAGYVLVRIEPALKELNKTVTLLSIVVARSSGLDYAQIRKDFDGNHC
jgi:hypothetical protein